mgnify:CR=1 FL=1
MIYDRNNLEHLKIIREAATDKGGEVILDFLRSEFDKLNYESIDENLPAELKGLEFEVIRKSKKYLNSVLKIINGEK